MDFFVKSRLNESLMLSNDDFGIKSCIKTLVLNV